MPPALPSYASGTSDVPLLGDTIGDNLDRTAARRPDGEALVDVATGRRWTYARVRRRGRRAGARSARRRRRATATGSGSGRRTSPSGCSSSTRRPRSARSWSTSTRPTARTSWSTCSTSPASGARRRAQLQDVRLRGDDRRGPAAVPGVAAGGVARATGVGRAGCRGRAATATSWPRRAGVARARTTRSTSSTRPAPPASPRARR